MIRLSFFGTWCGALTLAGGLLAGPVAQAQVRLPRLVSSGMVLQREAPVRIWGWAKAGENVTVAFLGKTYRATTGADGQWRVALPPLQAGGPYEMQIDASNHLVLKDVLVGRRVVLRGAVEHGATDAARARQVSAGSGHGQQPAHPAV